MADKQAVFDAWAPSLPADDWGPAWSNWAKPVLFAHLDGLSGSPPVAAQGLADSTGVPSSDGRTALVIDLPGPSAAQVGCQLALRGYFPVPLFNGCPGISACVPVEPIMWALVAGAEVLRQHPPAPESPPAFLLDSGRQGTGQAPTPGTFDNRWHVFPQDFPSANLLRARRIGSICVIQEVRQQPAEDLRHVLKRWQDAGLEVLGQTRVSADPPQLLQIASPNRFRAMWYRWLCQLGLRRSSAGGFGAVVPIPGSGG